MWHHTLLRWHAAHRPRGMLRGPQRGPAGTWGGSKPRPRLLHRHPSQPWRSDALHKQHFLSTQGCLHSGAGTWLLRAVADTPCFTCPTHAANKPHLVEQKCHSSLQPSSAICRKLAAWHRAQVSMSARPTQISRRLCRCLW